MPTELARLSDHALYVMLPGDVPGFWKRSMAVAKFRREERWPQHPGLLVLSYSPATCYHILWHEADLPQPVGRILPSPWEALPSAPIAAPSGSGKSG